MGEGEGLIIRLARQEDRAAIRALTLAAYAELAGVMAPSAWEGLDRAVRSGLESEVPGIQRIVAERDGRLQGSVMLYPAASDAYGGAAGIAAWPELRLLAVDRGSRGAGVGRALVEACVARAAAGGAEYLGLHTSASLVAATRLYLRLGFERAPEHDFQPDGAELVEAYRLRL